MYIQRVLMVYNLDMLLEYNNYHSMYKKLSLDTPIPAKYNHRHKYTSDGHKVFPHKSPH
jgi:hypothetical protein